MYITRMPGESLQEFQARVRQMLPQQAGEAPWDYHQRLQRESNLGSEELASFVGGAAEFGGVVAAGAVGSVFEYFRDLFGSIFSRGASTDAMERTDEALAVADLLMLAIGADGRVSDAEIALLRKHHQRSELGEDAEAALAAFMERMPAPGDDAGFERVARAAVPRVSREKRKEVYRAVVSLARQGSGLAVEADQRGGALGDGAALVTRFATLLGLSDEERRAVEAKLR